MLGLVKPAPEDVKWVGNEIRKARSALPYGGKTRSVLAHEAGVHDRTWGRIESGVYESGKPYSPLEPSIRLICAYLKLDPQPFLIKLGLVEPQSEEELRELVAFLRRSAAELEKELTAGDGFEPK